MTRGYAYNGFPSTSLLMLYAAVGQMSLFLPERGDYAGQAGYWHYARLLIDMLLFSIKNHCFKAYMSEVDRSQLPARYRAL